MKLEPLIRDLKITDKKIGVVPLVPNWAQQAYLAKVEEQLATTGKVRLIVLKARQLGLSTITEALMFVMCFVIPKLQGLVVTHEVAASQNLLKMTQQYWDTWAFNPLYQSRFQSRNDLAWTHGSAIRIATAGKKGAAGVGRSSTTHFLHASEVAFWDDPETLMLGLRQAIPDTAGTGIVLESTANGVGNYFERTWHEAVAGENEFFPLFFPWWKHYEYTASYTGLPRVPFTNPSDEEKALLKMGVSEDSLLWRRWALVNLCNGDHLKLAQEYPSTPEEAFISSGMNIFNYQLLQRVYEPETGISGELSWDGRTATFQPNPNGRLTIFRKPNDEGMGQYIIGGDATRSAGGAHSIKSDFAVAQVINRFSHEQVAIWRGKPDPATFANELFKLGMFFGKAELVPEIQGAGQFVISALLEKGYPNIYQDRSPRKSPGRLIADSHGWSTNALSKHLMIGALVGQVVEGSLTIHDQTTFLEMRDFVNRDNSSYGPADENNGHDDCVDALAMAVTANLSGGPVMTREEDTYPNDLADDPAWMTEEFY